MATGVVAHPKLERALGAMSTNLSGTAIAAAGSAAFTVMSGDRFGAVGTVPALNPASSSKSGIDGNFYDALWFERVHVKPRAVELGVVISEQTVLTEVFNTHRRTARSLTAVTVSGAAGVSVPNADAPRQFMPLESKVYSVKADSVGDAFIQDVVTWVFTGVPTSQTTLVLTGQRLVAFPFSAELDEPLQEALGYLTDILEADDGSEQRVQLRTVPIRGVEFTVVVLSARDLQHARALLQGWEGRTFGVPMWQYQQRSTADLSAGALTISVPTSNIPYDIGGLVFMWRDPFTWEARTILSTTSTTITFTSGSSRAWPAGTLVMPLRPGLISTKQAIESLTLKTGRARVSFVMDEVSG